MDRQNQIKRLAGILFIAVLPLLNPAYGADKNTRQTSPDGDEGYFGGGSPGNTNAMILWPRDDHNIVRKYRPAGSGAASPLAFKLWVNPGRRGGFPVNLKNAGAFCGFLENIDNDPDKDACICEDDPDRPYTGAPLGACAGVNFPACNPPACEPGTTEEPGETEQSCLEPIPPETEWESVKGIPFNATIFRNRNLYTTCTPYKYTRCGKEEEVEVCGIMKPLPCDKDPWKKMPWQPETTAAQVCEGETVTQTRQVYLDPICHYQDKYPQPETKRTITGVKTDGECAAPEPCTGRAWTTGSWSGKEAARICLGTTATQTRTVTRTDRHCVGGTPPVATRQITGTKYCPPSGPEPVTRPTCQWTTGTWTPGRSTVCAGEPLTQTRNVRKITAYCDGGAKPASSRSATGTKYCRPPNPPGPEPGTRPTCKWTTGTWSPSTATTCSDQRLSQSRSVTKITANCVGGTKPASTRTAPGSKRCSNCVPTSWSPGRDTVCAGNSFTQTRTLKNCGKSNRSARGTKCCGTVTTWSPGSATKCGAFTQTRTNACGKTESRQAKGTASWCGCSWGPYTPSPGAVCKGKTFTQKSYYSCSGRTNKPRTRTATGTRSCQKAECSNGQSYCSAYKRYLCRNGKWEVIAHGPYACFTP